MATATPLTATELTALQTELDKFGFKGELGRTVFIQALCQSMEDTLLNYQAAALTSDEGLQQIADMIEVFKAISFKANGQDFTIAAEVVESAIPGVPAYTCTPPKVCVNGVCVDPPKTRG